MYRHWMMKESGTVGTVMVRIPNDVTTMLADEDMYMVVSSDANFR